MRRTVAIVAALSILAAVPVAPSALPGSEALQGPLAGTDDDGLVVAFIPLVVLAGVGHDLRRLMSQWMHNSHA